MIAGSKGGEAAAVSVPKKNGAGRSRWNAGGGKKERTVKRGNSRERKQASPQKKGRVRAA